MIAACVGTLSGGTPAGAQDPPHPAALVSGPLTLAAARTMARRASPELISAREAVIAASARARQSRALPNPTLSWQHEQTSSSDLRNTQSITALDQLIEIGGARRARRTAGELREQVAEARLSAVEAQLDFDVVRAYALAVAADRRAALAQEATGDFAKARVTSGARLAEGDISGYANRRIRLEAARYGGLLAEASVAQRSARLLLLSLIASSADSLSAFDLSFDDLAMLAPAAVPTDSLTALATQHRGELRAAKLEADAAAADTRLARRERIPAPMVSAGFKNESVTGAGGLNGFVAGVSLPLPLWDRRQGAIAAADADARRSTAEVEIVRRRIAREVGEAAAQLRAVQEQVALLAPQLGAESTAALNAARVAYAEGEITLVEWLDAVRAYMEAESTFASLRAESLIRRAALDRAVGVSLSRELP